MIISLIRTVRGKREKKAFEDEEAEDDDSIDQNLEKTWRKKNEQAKLHMRRMKLRNKEIAAKADKKLETRERIKEHRKLQEKWRLEKRRVRESWSAKKEKKRIPKECNGITRQKKQQLQQA